MFKIFVTDTFKQLYQRIPKVIQNKADEKTEIFVKNPFHPSLRTKKLEPRHQEVWSFWVDKDYRIKFRFVRVQEVHFLFIGNRKDIYR